MVPEPTQSPFKGWRQHAKIVMSANIEPSARVMAERVRSVVNDGGRLDFDASLRGG